MYGSSNGPKGVVIVFVQPGRHFTFNTFFSGVIKDPLFLYSLIMRLILKAERSFNFEVLLAKEVLPIEEFSSIRINHNDLSATLGEAFLFCVI